MIVALIDGDIFAYKASFGHESEVDLGDDIISLQADLAEIETTVVDLIEAVKDKLKAERTIVALSDDANFRKAIYASYKANRSPRRKPIGLRHAKKVIAEKFETRVRPQLEADDVLGIIGTMETKPNEKRVIVTIDKDLLQIPGRHFNPDKNDKRVVTPEQGDVMFFSQCLTGDSTDNYPGCKGVGPKGVERLFAETGANWATILAAYERAGFDEQYALTQARLARILRNTDYDFKKKEPILWTP
jgi:DNA polymerase-1